MFRLQETVHLDSQETIVSMFRSHAFKMTSRAIPLILVLMALFLFVFPLFSLGAVGVGIFFFLFFTGMFFLFRTVCNWLGTYYVLTNRRLLCIQRTGFFKKQVDEILLENITELSYITKGIVQTLFHFGNVRLALMTARGEFIILSIAKPQTILDILSRQAAAVRKRKPPQTLQGALRPHDSRKEDNVDEIPPAVTLVHPVEKEPNNF
jgi:hypothetical protein